MMARSLKELLTSPLMGRCFSCGVDPNYLFTTIALSVCVGDQENDDTTSQTERLPPFLWAFVAVLDRQVARVIEHQAGGVRSHSMFFPVSSIFDLVPFKPPRLIVVSLL